MTQCPSNLLTRDDINGLATKEDIEGLKATINNLESTIISLFGDVEAGASLPDITALVIAQHQGTRNRLNESISSAKNEIINKIGSLDTALSNINNRLNSIDSSVNTIKNKLDSIEGDINKISDEISSLKDTLNIIKNKIEEIGSKVNELGETLGEISNKINEFGGTLTLILNNTNLILNDTGYIKSELEALAIILRDLLGEVVQLIAGSLAQLVSEINILGGITQGLSNTINQNLPVDLSIITNKLDSILNNFPIDFSGINNQLNKILGFLPVDFSSVITEVNNNESLINQLITGDNSSNDSGDLESSGFGGLNNFGNTLSEILDNLITIKSKFPETNSIVKAEHVKTREEVRTAREDIMRNVDDESDYLEDTYLKGIQFILGIEISDDNNVLPLGELPTSLLNIQGEESLTTINNYPELFMWYIKQFDALIGQFPLDIDLEDIDLTEEGNQSVSIKVANIGEALSELIGNSTKNITLNDASMNILLRFIPEISRIRQLGLTTQDLVVANREFLGYADKETIKEIESQFTLLKDIKDIEGVLKPEKEKYKTIKFDGKETLLDYLLRLQFVAQLQKENLLKPLSELDSFMENSNNNQETNLSNWNEFLANINNPNSQFNLDEKPSRVRDIQGGN